MHGHASDFLSVVSTGLGLYYLVLCAMNWITALLLWRRGPSKTYFSILGFEVNNALTWFVVGCFFLILSPLAFIGMPPELTTGTKHLVNSLSGPVTLTVGSLAGMAIFFFFRRFLTQPAIAWTVFNLSLFVMGMSMTDPN